MPRTSINEIRHDDVDVAEAIQNYRRLSANNHTDFVSICYDVHCNTLYPLTIVLRFKPSDGIDV